VSYQYKLLGLLQLKPRDAKAILFGLKFAKDIHSKLRLRRSLASIKKGFRASKIYRHIVYSSSMLGLVQPRCMGFHVM